MLYFLLQTSLYFVLLFSCYQMVFKHLGYFHFNRFFLISIIPLSAWLSQLSIEAYYLNQWGFFSSASEHLVKPLAHAASDYVVSHELQSLGILPKWIFAIHLLGVGFFGLKLLISIFKLVKIYIQSDLLQLDDRTYHITDKAQPAFSFFHLVFLHPDFVSRDKRQTYILRHEQIHSRQLHSVDLFIAQLIQVVFWFHPLSSKLAQEIRLNHEFLADHGVCQSHSKQDYFRFLLSFKMQNSYNLAVNHFACHPLKRRAKSAALSRKVGLKHLLTLVLVIPVGGVLMSAFSTGEYVSPGVTRAYQAEHKDHLHFHINHNNQVILYEQGEYGTTVKLEK